MGVTDHLLIRKKYQTNNITNLETWHAEDGVNKSQSVFITIEAECRNWINNKNNKIRANPMSEDISASHNCY